MTTDRWRALLVDDEPPARRTLQMLLARHPSCAVVGECDHAEAAVEAIRRLSPDLVFIDVQMPGATGIDVIKRAGVGVVPVVVFTTAYANHAVSAFEVCALDYLLKPFSDDRFDEVMARVTRALSLARPVGIAPAPRSLLVKDGAKTLILPIAEIDWLEAEDYCTRIHAGARHPLVRRSIRSLLGELQPYGFVRAHRSAVVNVQRIREVRTGDSGDGQISLTDGTLVRLSRTCRSEVSRRLALTE